MAGEETDAGLNLIKYLSVEKGDIVSCPTFRRSNLFPLSIRVLIFSPPFVRLLFSGHVRIRGVGYVNPVFIKGRLDATGSTCAP